ncbi:hypothetical protein MHAS_04660 [Mycolicibacterium hassiacum DSM 44199]|nr:hypothetical protein [Mycolicibacterium hassiacum DSM 44199]VCT92923.1 hypothetical protein MHAS_04660 [Mycolicibacterium hassiacum DSM 44199]
MSGPVPVGPLAARIVVGLLVAIGVAVLAGAVLLWPSGRAAEIPLPFQDATGGAVTTEAGHVLSTQRAGCGSPSVGAVLTTTQQPAPAPVEAGRCVLVRVGIDSGPNRGADTVLEFSGGPGQPNLVAGDDIRIIRQVDEAGVTSYAFYDYERGWPLIALAALFAVVVVAVARWRGLRALIGIVIAFVVLVVFLLPALRDGAPAVPLALVGSAAILYAVIYLAHGVSLRTSSALLGTLTSLLLAAVLSWAAIELAHLTGLSEDQNNEVAAYLGGVSITGLLLAGFIIVRWACSTTSPSPRRRRCSNWPSSRAVRGGRSSSARCGWAATTSPARSTRWCWPTRAVRCRCCCCSASPTARWPMC